MRDERAVQPDDEFVSAFPDDEFGGQLDYVHDRDDDRDRDRADIERDDGDVDEDDERR